MFATDTTTARAVALRYPLVAPRRQHARVARILRSAADRLDQRPIGSVRAAGPTC
jgi:hypothetical protein